MRLMLVAALVAGIGAATSAGAATPPVSAFARLPMVEEVRISPDGRRLAIASSEDGRGAVGIATIDGQGLVAARLADVQVHRLQWLDDDYLLAEVNFPQKFGARTLSIQRVAAIWAADGHVASMLLGDDVGSANRVRHDVIGLYRGPPARAWVVGEAGRAGDAVRTPELFRVNPADGKGEPVERGTLRTLSWGFDDKGEVDGRLDMAEHNQMVMLTRPSPGGAWTPFWKSQNEDDVFGFQGQSAAEKGVYISHYSTAGRQLVIKHFADGSETPVGPPHLEEPVRMVWDPYRIRLSGRGFGDDAITYEWYDPELESVHAAVARVFPGQDAQLLDWSRDRSRFVVWVNEPDTPLAWYLFDRGRHEVSPIGEEYPELKGVALGKTRWINYAARDGLPIHAWLTLPPGASATARGLPLIVLPHDGPASRDRPNFSYLAQFLATRGYAVLRPQYRGSADFGAAFRDAGQGQWGSGMQTDLLDGVGDLVRQGFVDPRRVCIVGQGFGGYAALAAATLHPDDYACAVSISGASNLKAVLANSGGAFQGWAAELKKTSYRDPIYEAMSPSLHARAVRAPILLVSVDHDAEAPTEQTQLMRDALAAAHKPFEELVLKDTDHDLSSAAARTQLLQALEAFLSKALSPR
jgi:dipeptidyl aminopeptidase/acylaminoacyl peptidase